MNVYYNVYSFEFCKEKSSLKALNYIPVFQDHRLNIFSRVYNLKSLKELQMECTVYLGTATPCITGTL